MRVITTSTETLDPTEIGRLEQDVSSWLGRPIRLRPFRMGTDWDEALIRACAVDTYALLYLLAADELDDVAFRDWAGAGLRRELGRLTPRSS